ncbi:conjugal transfer protein TraF [Saprospiraceae bacterium]|jgi:glutaredoxin|nr:conjugal transfer protein TraF [Bacteroidota bacterium]MDB4727349.1 conjugal transfer protein TraF [Saprospiraceae bacterium]MDF1863741.1 thioredoxin family protein [Saprospiraceae bacterium]
MKKTVFYHVGCPVCLSAEQEVLTLIDTQKVDLEVVHLGTQRAQISRAETLGVKSVPALVTGSGNVLHLNFGASMADEKAS